MANAYHNPGGKYLHENKWDTPDSRTFLREVLKAIWMDNTPEDVKKLWKFRVASGGRFPGEALECLDRVVQNPPCDLVELLQENGWVFLVHQEGGEEHPFTFDEHVEWLRQQVALLRLIFQKDM